MPKSIYCCKCGKEKEEGEWREKHYRCRSCYLEGKRLNRRALLDSKGIPPKREGKSPNCYWCGSLKESPKAGLCNPCRAKEARELRARKRAEKGLAPFAPGRKPECTRCGKIRENPDASYCHGCSRELRVLQEAARAEKGLPSYNEARSPNCYSCGKEKENRKKGYCRQCASEKARVKPGVCRVCSVPYVRVRKCGCAEMESQKRLEMKNDQKYNDFFFKEEVRRITAKAIKKGIITRQPCQVCGIEKVDAHHEDYTKPLDVLWLCRLHHMQHHYGKISLKKD